VAHHHAFVEVKCDLAGISCRILRPLLKITSEHVKS
jgi:hypothetical protein